MPWIICIGVHLEGRDKADKCGDGWILDHIWKGKKRPGWCQLSQIREGMGAGGVLSLLRRWGRDSSEELGTWAPLPAWEHSKQTLAPVFYSVWEMGYSLLSSSLTFVISFPHPPLAPSVLYPPSVYPLFSYRGISLPILREGGPNWSWRWLNPAFPFNSSAHLLPSSLPQTRKNTVTQNAEWQGQPTGQQQWQSQSCEQFLPFFAVHSDQVLAT